MHTIETLFTAHPFWGGVSAFWIFSAVVSGMPAPEGSGKAYTWAYNSLHAVSANLDRAFGSKIPGMSPTSGE